MNVLSLFDGLSGAHLALDRAKIKVDKYYASEIDKYAISITQKNYPDTIQLGSVVDLTDEQLKDMDIDILIGGSPCQGFSVAGKMKGMSTSEGIDVTTLEQYLKLKKEGFEFDGQSYLFWEFIRVKSIIKPKYFLLENVRVQKKWKDIFDEVVGVTPILINSALVSAQNRQRYYWTNIEGINQPEDRGILLKDIIESGEATNEMTSKGKSYCVTARYSGAVAWNSIERKQRSMILERPCALREPTKDSLCIHVADATDIKGHDSIKRVYSEEGKSPTVNTCTGGNREVKVLTSEAKYRKLLPLECERLQTVPEGYTEGVSNSQRYKMLGNGYTIEVVAHILKNIPKEK